MSSGMGMDSLAVTDHGNLHAAWSFYEAAKAAKIRPILGFEAYLAFGSRRQREKPSGAPAFYSHLVLLAQNRTGYKNLIKLSSIGFTEGFYRRPRIDKEVLEAHSEGIVCLAACLSGEVALYLRQGNYEEARRSRGVVRQVASDPTGSGWKSRSTASPRRTRSPRACSGWARISGSAWWPPTTPTTSAGKTPRRMTSCWPSAPAPTSTIRSGSASRGRNRTSSPRQEMRALFPDHPETIDNTQRVADLCEFDFEKRYFLPSFPRPAGYATDEALLDHLARGGERPSGTGRRCRRRCAERLEYELGVINTAGYAGYFLIVQDFIAAARERGIPVGPGRGSAAGSLVAYALRITDVDPLRFDLLFERFLNPERVSMPDIDVDFCFERRGEVIEYVRQRYGRESVGQIVTFGTMKARAAVKDVARVLKIPARRSGQDHQADPLRPGVQPDHPRSASRRWTSSGSW